MIFYKYRSYPNSLQVFAIMHWISLVICCAACLVYCEETDEDYASYANLYPEISKKIGEEPIEILDVVKAILVYDSDNDIPADPGSTTPPNIAPENATESETETFRLRLKNGTS